jgi:signal transduction histidine kinase
MDELERQRAAARERQSYVRHELRAPLAVMYPVISLLAEELAGPLTADQRRYLDILLKAAERLQSRITSATESGWLNCAGVPRLVEPVPLGELVEEHARMRAFRRAGGPPIRLIRAAEGAADAVAWADREELRAVVSALLENACAASPDEGEVTVAVASTDEGDAAALVVSDPGPGMPAEVQAGAVEFGHGAEDIDEHSGLGIGLWVARELATRNGGSLHITSRAGEGMRVEVKLPSAEAAARVGGSHGTAEV